MRAVVGICAAVVVSVVPRAAPAVPKPLDRLWAYETRGQLPQAVVADQTGRYLFAALKAGGLAVLRLGGATDPPAEVARVPVARLGRLDVMHLARRGDRLYLALGDLFAAGGAPAGLAVVSVATPAAPRVLGVWTTPTPASGAAVVVADDRYAYLGTMREGVTILDVADPARITPVATFRPDPDFPRPNPTRAQHPNARGLALAGDRLYVAYDAGGVRVLDVSDRARPREVGRYVNPGMGAKQQAYNNLVVGGDTAYAAVDYAGLEVLDVRDPARIRQVGWWNPWKADTVRNLWFNSPGHTNQLALDRQRDLVYLSAGDSDLCVVSVADPRKPELVYRYGGPKDGRGVWGATLAGDAVYLSYIQAAVPFRGTWSGIVAVKAR